MARLISELKREHANLLTALDEVKNLGIVSDEGRDRLLGAKGALLAHLSKEDELLYPTLERAAAVDHKLQRTLDVFARDLHMVTDTALLFFQRYEANPTDMQLAMDFGKLYGILKLRIQKEESVLYAAYQALPAE